jgi:hypothetical protein
MSISTENQRVDRKKYNSEFDRIFRKKEKGREKVQEKGEKKSNEK